ncbi:MAG TPA: hypothetical protein VIL85_23250, partial [Thermomicrobiales bacterium]
MASAHPRPDDAVRHLPIATSNNTAARLLAAAIRGQAKIENRRDHDFRASGANPEQATTARESTRSFEGIPNGTLDHREDDRHRRDRTAVRWWHRRYRRSGTPRP